MIPLGHTAVGLRGIGMLASVDGQGFVHARGEAQPLRWLVAGDDRWYDPATESSVRQTTRDGYPIVVTKMRVPTGDVTALTYCVADQGGLVVLEIRNDSTLPFALVLSDPAWRTVRTPVPMHDAVTQAKMLEHVNFPQSSVIHPIGHQASLRFALGDLSREQIEVLPSVDQVATGWERALASSTRLNLPDHGVVKDVNTTRSQLLMECCEYGDLADQVIATNEVLRLGEKLNDDALNDFVGAIEDLVGNARGRGLSGLFKRRNASTRVGWFVDAALTGAIHGLHKLGQHQAANDAITMRHALLTERGIDTLPAVEDLMALSPIKRLARVDLEFARVSAVSTSPGTDIVPLLSSGRIGNPGETWLGVNFEAHGLAALRGTVGYAVRWHGERAAVLWEVSDTTALPLSSVANDPDWRSNELTGEALMSPPNKHD